MAVKIVFSDIDGTFLNSEHKVLPKTAAAVKSLLARDIPFVLVSARMPEAIYPITDGIGIKIPVISYSGALVVTDKGEEIFDRRIKPADTIAVINAIEERFPMATMNYYAGRHWYVKDTDDKRVRLEMSITSAKAENADFDTLLQNGIHPNKILVMTNATVCERMERELGGFFAELNVVRSSPTLLEIMDKSVNKADGIKVLLRHYNLTSDQALAFGDNYNDLEMLRYVKTGVAMANAPEDVKKAATEVTADNDSEGIFAYLDKSNLL